MKPIFDPKKYCFNCFYCDNIVSQPDVVGLLYLGFPRCFVLIPNAFYEFKSYEDFVNGAIKINWLDPNEPRTKDEEVEVLTKLWNFSVLQEREEERLYDEECEDDDDIFD